MAIRFPTHPHPESKKGRPLMGVPFEAVACHCERPILDVDDPEACVGCGHWTVMAIRNTWAERVRAIAGEDRELAA